MPLQNSPPWCLGLVGGFQGVAKVFQSLQASFIKHKSIVSFVSFFRVVSYPMTADYRWRWVYLGHIGPLHPRWPDQWCAVWQESPRPLWCPKSSSSLLDKPEDSSWSLSDLYVRTASRGTRSQSLNRERVLLSEQ